MNVFVLLFYIYIYKKKKYINSYTLFPFCPADLAIVASVAN